MQIVKQLRLKRNNGGTQMSEVKKEVKSEQKAPEKKPAPKKVKTVTLH